MPLLSAVARCTSCSKLLSASGPTQLLVSVLLRVRPVSGDFRCTRFQHEFLPTVYLVRQQLAEGLLVALWQFKDVLQGSLQQCYGPHTRDNPRCEAKLHWQVVTAEGLQVLDD